MEEQTTEQLSRTTDLIELAEKLYQVVRKQDDKLREVTAALNQQSELLAKMHEAMGDLARAINGHQVILAALAPTANLPKPPVQ